jgi:hypothetical protein
LSEHVLYECEMLEAVVALLGGAALNRLDGRTNVAVENALVESFGMHVRALIEFLYTDSPKRPDDGIAADLVSDVGMWTDEREAMPAALSDAKRRADKEIAHVTLSRSRLADEARTWATGQVYAQVMEVVKAFVTCVDPATVVPDWHKRMWQTIPGFVRGREHFYRPPNVPTQGLPPRSREGPGPSP